MGCGKERVVNLVREQWVGEITSNVLWHGRVTKVGNNV